MMANPTKKLYTSLFFYFFWLHVKNVCIDSYLLSRLKLPMVADILMGTMQDILHN